MGRGERQDVLNGTIRQANSHLMYRRFDECLNVCHAGVESALTTIRDPHPNTAPHARAHQAMTTLCMVAVQAYAELNRWQEAVPYVTSVFDGIQNCPGAVLQLCISLHAYMEEYSTATALAQVWLGSKASQGLPEYGQVALTYMERVVLKQKLWESVPSFLDSCPGLSVKQHSELKDYAKKVEAHVTAAEAQEREKEAEEIRKTQKEKRRKKKLKEKSQATDPPFILRLLKGIASWFPSGMGTYLRRIVMFLCLMYLLVTRANISMLSYDQLAPLVIAVKQLWQSLCRPILMLRS